MIATKTKFLAIVMLTLFPLVFSTAVVNASKMREFHLEGPQLNVVGEMWGKNVDGIAVVMKYAVEGVVETREHVVVGTLHLDVFTILWASGPSPVSARFVISLYSGKTIVGTIAGTQTVTSAGVDVRGRFVGHGDMHVMGIVDDIGGQPGTLILDGYSW